MDSPDAIPLFARTNFRDTNHQVGLTQADRLLHTYVIGQTGVGKTTLLHNLVLQDLLSGRGFALLDPHGDVVASVAAQVPDHRRHDVYYLNAPDRDQPYGYNPLKHVSSDKRSLAASGILEVFKKLWSDAWGVRMEHILRNALLTLLDQPYATLADIQPLLTDRSFRNQALRHVHNEHVRTFWRKEYDKYSYRLRADAIAPIQNKIGAFLAHPTLARILTEPQKELSLRKIMDEGKVLLVNLSKGQLGEDAAHLLGGLLMTTIGLAAFSRAELPEHARRPFFLYVDEFQNFTTLSVATMASELRKYKVGLILAHQYLDQLERPIRDAVLGNIGTLIAFRLGPRDATFLEKEYYPVFDRHDLANLPNHQIYVRLMIEGTPSRPFSATTLAPEEFRHSTRRATV